MHDPVGADYRHRPKDAGFVGWVETSGVAVKVYRIAPAGEGTDEDALDIVDRWATTHLATIATPGDRGFVIYHHCGPEFRFLLPSIWRGSNELWEAVWARTAANQPFSPFDHAYPDNAGALRPTYCVWELGVVAHEAASWSRFLASERSAEYGRRWRDDVWSGEVR